MIVSVVIPVKNRTFELRRAIDSVLSQTFTGDLEILIIDDKSDREDVKKTVEEFDDDRIKYILNNKAVNNANVCRNIGVQRASGEYIAMLDSDDEWLPDHLEKKVSFIKENNCDGVFGSFYIDDGESKVDVVSRPRKKGEEMINYLLTDGRAATPTQVYKADAAKSIGWDDSLKRHQDYDFSVRFAEKYKYVASQDVTCIVHWKKGEGRTEHFESQMAFMKKHGAKVKPLIYNNYHSAIYQSIKESSIVKKEVVDYFKKESSRYIHDMSLNNYLAIYKNDKSGLGRMMLRVKFVIKVLFHK